MKLVVLLALSWAMQCVAAPSECEKMAAEQLDANLKLSYQQFDQTPDAGFRVLAKHGCNKEAADTIAKYIATTGATQSSLRWHIAQLRAEQGNYPQAIEYARTVLAEKEDFAAMALRWNDYVLATIAFLEHDRSALVLHRNKVEEGKTAHFGNALNLKLLDSLVRNFDESYAYAVSHIE